MSKKLCVQKKGSVGAFESITPVIAGLMASLILWSFFTPTTGGPYDMLVAKMLGPATVLFSVLGLFIIAFMPNTWSVRSCVKAFVTLGVLTCGSWLLAL